MGTIAITHTESHNIPRNHPFRSEMHPIVARAQLSPNVTRLVVEAPRIAEIRRPGQFVIVRRGPGAERIPLTIADVDRSAGTITLVIQAIGKSTHDLTALTVGDAITGHRGAARQSDDAARERARGVRRRRRRTAVVYPIAQALAKNGVKVTSVIGGRSREWVIYEDELRATGEVIVCTDDRQLWPPGLRDGGPQGTVRGRGHRRGLRHRPGADDAGLLRAHAPVLGSRTTGLAELDHDRRDGHVRRLPCRHRRQDQYACCDGPEFDGHKVDFRQLAID